VNIRLGWEVRRASTLGVWLCTSLSSRQAEREAQSSRSCAPNAEAGSREGRACGSTMR
jgi:hypothetical protein